MGHNAISYRQIYRTRTNLPILRSTTFVETQLIDSNSIISCVIWTVKVVFIKLIFISITRVGLLMGLV